MFASTWRSGYNNLNREERNLNQSKDDYFVERWPRTIAETMATATKFVSDQRYVTFQKLENIAKRKKKQKIYNFASSLSYSAH